MNKKGLIQFRFVELFTGNNIPNMYHVVKTEKGTTIAAGNTDNNGVVRLSNQEGVILCSLVSSFAINQDTNKIGRTVP